MIESHTPILFHYMIINSSLWETYTMRQPHHLMQIQNAFNKNNFIQLGYWLKYRPSVYNYQCMGNSELCVVPCLPHGAVCQGLTAFYKMIMWIPYILLVFKSLYRYACVHVNATTKHGFLHSDVMHRHCNLMFGKLRILTYDTMPYAICQHISVD